MASLKKPAAKPAASSKIAVKPSVKVPVKKAATPADEEDAPPVKKAASTRKPPPNNGKGRAALVKPVWEAPSDFAPASFAFKLRSDRWGMVDTRSVSGERIRGRWDNADAKRFDLATYDHATLRAFAMAISAATYATNPARRLPPNQAFLFIVRCVKAKDTGILRARFIAIATKSKTDKKLVWYEDKKDLVYRKLRRAARILPSVFVDVQLPPKIRRGQVEEDASDAG